LLCYICAKFGRTLTEAARDDCAQLIAASATNPAQDQKCRDAWKDWLLAARCWACLARCNWNYSQSRAAELVIERLEKRDGLNLDNLEGREIIRSVGRLEMIDLVAQEVLQEAFPESEMEEEGGKRSRSHGHIKNHSISLCFAPEGTCSKL